MKLNELNLPRHSERLAKVIENQLGLSVKLDKLNEFQTRHLLRRVRARLSEQRNSQAVHNSEKNANYLSLMMMEQALTTKLGEQTPMAATAAPAGAATGVADPAQSAAKIKMADQERKKQIQELIKAKQKELQDLQKQLSAPPSPVTALESRRSLRESEVQQAQVVLAAQDMVDRVQKMMEDISEMQFKDLPALSNSIKNDMGVDQATQFQTQASAALTQLLTAVQEGKTALEAAQGAITGQAPVVPGEEAVGAELGAEAGADLGAELDAELGTGDEAGAEPAEPEEEPETAALGRERR